LVMVAIACAVVASAVYLYPKVGKELVPDDDQGEFSISVRLPTGTSYARTEEFIKPIEKDVLSLPDMARVYVTANAGNASFLMSMTPLESRTTSQQDNMRSARALLRKYQGARVSVTGSTDISGAANRGTTGAGGNRLTVLIQGPDVEQLQAYTVQLMEKIRTI